VVKGVNDHDENGELSKHSERTIFSRPYWV